jgi:putative tricarboxylic transport membrane protein
VRLAEVAFEFGPAEYFSLMGLGLIGAVVLASGPLLKVIATGFGFAKVVINVELPEAREIFTNRVTNLWPSKEDFKRIITPMLRGITLGAVLGILRNWANW